VHRDHNIGSSLRLTRKLLKRGLDEQLSLASTLSRTTRI
jgi:hypothetical protein